MRQGRLIKLLTLRLIMTQGMSEDWMDGVGMLH